MLKFFADFTLLSKTVEAVVEGNKTNPDLLSSNDDDWEEL